MRKPKRTTLTYGGVLLVGLIFGLGLDQDQVITKTVEVPAEAPPEPEVEIHYQLPTECEEALHLANGIWRTAGAIDSKSSEQLDIISEVRIALGEHDFQGLLEAENDQRNLQNHTVGAVVRLSQDMSDFQTAMHGCEQGGGEQ